MLIGSYILGFHLFSYFRLVIPLVDRYIDGKQNEQAKPAMETGNTSELVDPKLQDKYDDQQMNKLVLTASHCVQQSPILRPTMTQVGYIDIFDTSRII